MPQYGLLQVILLAADSLNNISYPGHPKTRIACF